MKVLNDKTKNLGRYVFPVYGVDFFAKHLNILQSSLLAMSGYLVHFHNGVWVLGIVSRIHVQLL